MTDNKHAPDVPQAATQYALTALRRCGLHEKTADAIEAMAFEGLSLPLAAKRAEMRPDNLARAFNRKRVKTAFKQVVAAIRENAAQAAYLRINHLAQTSDSQRLQYDASRWVAGVDGISPVQKVQGQINHSVTFGGYDYSDALEHEPAPSPRKLTDSGGK